MITVNHYADGYWSVTGIPIDRNVLAKSLYHYGELKPNYPVPALLQDSETNLAKRWSGWYDTDRFYGHKY